MNTNRFSWFRRVALTLALAIPLIAAAQSDKPFSQEQLDQMTAPVALYPDSLLSQLFMATTYPDEFAKAAAWSKAHPDSKGDDAVKMVENEDWDPSVQSMVGFPEVLITLGDKPEWVKNMGDAFLAQPEDVMDSVQRLRAQAQKAGNLKSNEQVNVTMEAAPPPQPSTTTIVQQTAPPPQVIVIQPAQPSVIYVPAYNPAYVYGPWLYPAYPPFYYPPPPGYWFSRTVATGIAWGIGIGVSNALWGGFNWGHGNVNINVNRYNNINVNNRINVNTRNTTWNHNTAHRTTDYRGGNAARQNYDHKYQSGNRDQYRGRDPGGTASRDASRDRANQAMQQRGFTPDKGGAANNNRPQTNSNAARQNAQNMDRSAARDRAQAAGHDNALRGANNSQARQQMDRGTASRQAGGGMSRPQGGGGGGARPAATSRPSGGASRPSGGASRPAGGGGRPGGGGGGGGGGGRHR